MPSDQTITVLPPSIKALVKLWPKGLSSKILLGRIIQIQYRVRPLSLDHPHALELCQVYALNTWSSAFAEGDLPWYAWALIPKCYAFHLKRLFWRLRVWSLVMERVQRDKLNDPVVHTIKQALMFLDRVLDKVLLSALDEKEMRGTWHSEVLDAFLVLEWFVGKFSEVDVVQWLQNQDISVFYVNPLFLDWDSHLERHTEESAGAVRRWKWWPLVGHEDEEHLVDEAFNWFEEWEDEAPGAKGGPVTRTIQHEFQLEEDPADSGATRGRACTMLCHALVIALISMIAVKVYGFSQYGALHL
ncbi:hypothetical protein EW146_g4372 [Bondarzewia mesenterica]|uniref:Uncharacterized protein n=1 Tax=Bondarzewia mesenterica TaxID=1095465 RepID=A0A4S4LVB1_9AGAM|nr:hypothetical protein EW146_g4372 [Bondarzewia mesenterica]